MHKTASTTIQSFLANNVVELERLGFLFPKLNLLNNIERHYKLALDFALKEKSNCRAILQDEIHRAGWPDSIVISSETFSHFIARDDMRDRLAAFFSTLGYAIEVIVYIRPQLCAINSLFAQQVTRLEIDMDFNQYADRFSRIPAHDLEVKYKPLINDKRFKTQFVPFNSALRTGGICNDFLSRLNVNKEFHERFKAAPDLNLSPGPKTVAAMLRIATRMKSLHMEVSSEVRLEAARAVRGIADERGWNDKKFNGLTKAHKKMIFEKFAPANDRFARLAWSQPWHDSFCDDEKTAMQAPRCVFHLPAASEPEREEFLGFVRSALAMVHDFNRRLKSPAPE